MSPYKRIFGKFSNWETVGFFLIKKLMVGDDLYFSRSELMTQKHLDFAVKLLKYLGHKEDPQHPEETLQRTIQNLRNKGYIEFLGQGEYKLSEDGFTAISEIDKKLPIKNVWSMIEDFD